MKTETGSFRFEPEYMAKLRMLIKARGKLWFYKLVERECNKLTRKEQEND